MPAQFNVTDAEGNGVSLAAVVSLRAAELREGVADSGAPFDETPPCGRLLLRVAGVRVRSDFQPPASSHTARMLETETCEGADR